MAQIVEAKFRVASTDSALREPLHDSLAGSSPTLTGFGGLNPDEPNVLIRGSQPLNRRGRSACARKLSATTLIITPVNASRGAVTTGAWPSATLLDQWFTQSLPSLLSTP
jgi:hypothetical protein